LGPPPAKTKIMHASPSFRSAELSASGGSVLDLLDGAEDHRRGALDGLADQVPVAVAAMDLGESPFDRHELAVRAGGHVAVGQHAGKRLRRWLELQAQDVGESPFAGLDDGAGVVGDQPAQHGGGVLGVAQVTGAVEWVEARRGKAGRVADVVQPCGGCQEIGVSAENMVKAACPGGHALDVRPPAGEGLLKECLSEMSGPGSQRVHAAQARQRERDIHGRGMPSEDVLSSITSRPAAHAGLGEAGSAPSGILQVPGGITGILTR
jgi:hypothetical protein